MVKTLVWDLLRSDQALDAVAEHGRLADAPARDGSESCRECGESCNERTRDRMEPNSAMRMTKTMVCIRNGPMVGASSLGPARLKPCRMQ